MRILNSQGSGKIKKIMQDIWVDKAGIRIMLPKSKNYLIKINNLSNICANILKQEMLSLGGDVAIARGALTGKSKRTDCLIMGNRAQFNRLNCKLRSQPFNLERLSKDISLTIENYERHKFLLNLGRYKLHLGNKTKIMGVVNLTPDSFSGDGLYQKSEVRSQKSEDDIIDFVERMVKDGADIIDVGGQSSRPGARPVSVKEELRRTLPVIKRLRNKIKVPLSIDTYRPEVAKACLDNGASIVNDITGLRDPKMVKVAAKYKCGVVIMHMKGMPKTMQDNPRYKSLIDEIIEYLKRAINRVLDCGIDREKIIIDPGIGFGKTLQHNLSILNNLDEFKVLGRPILVGPSRKSFIGTILNLPPKERIFGTVSSCVLAVKNGAHIVRVHDIKQVKEAVRVMDAINKLAWKH